MSRLVAAGLRGLRRLSQEFPQVAGLRGARRMCSLGAPVEPGVNLGLKPFGIDWGIKVPLGSDNLPLYVNWLNVKGAISGVRDQRRCGSCYICSGMTSLESLYFLQTGGQESVRLSTQHILDCHTIGNNGCGGGKTEVVFDYVVKNGGVLLESSYPIAGTGERSVCKYMEEDGLTLSGWRHVKRHSEEALKYVVAHQPVVVSLASDKRLHKYVPDWTSWTVVHGPGKLQKLNHSAVIIGYDTTPWGLDVWIMLNSWGWQFGYAGQCLLARNTGVDGGTLGILRDPIIPVKQDNKGIVQVKSRCESCPVCI